MSRRLTWQPRDRKSSECLNTGTSKGTKTDSGGFDGSKLGRSSKISPTQCFSVAPAPQWWEPGAVCWHCKGTRNCRCIVCDIGGPLGLRAGPCVRCGGSGIVPEKPQLAPRLNSSP